MIPDDADESLVVEPFSGSSDAWDELVCGFEGSTFAHLMGWRRVMGDVLGHECFYWVARNGRGRVRGLLPLARVKSRIFGDYLVSLPFLSYGGPLGSPAARETLVSAARETSRDLGVDLLELRARGPLPGGLDVSDRKITVLMDLPSDPEELWTHGIKSKLRSQIKRPMKEGMEVDIGPDCLESFYDVFTRTMRDLGTPVLPRRLFEVIAEEFPDQAVFCTVKHQGQPAAAGCGFLWLEEFEITWAGADRAFSRLAPNMLLYWTLMEESIRRGARTFNFGRCSPDSGTHRFKRQWPSRDQPLQWAQWSPTGVVATPNPDSPKFRLATAVWRRLPLSLTNLMGPRISRLLP